MEHVHYLILDEIIVMGKENNCRYKTIQEVSTLDEVWKKEVKIIDSYGDHELSGYYPKTGMFMTKMMMNLPSPVIKLLSIMGGPSTIVQYGTISNTNLGETILRKYGCSAPYTNWKEVNCLH